jgi:hypothetical protein
MAADGRDDSTPNSLFPSTLFVAQTRKFVLLDVSMEFQKPQYEAEAYSTHDARTVCDFGVVQTFYRLKCVDSGVATSKLLI